MKRNAICTSSLLVKAFTKISSSLPSGGYSFARQAILDNALASKKGTFDCISCHMPYESKSAVAAGQYVGDVRTHIFEINADSLADPFTADGKFANHYVTLEYVCLGCHTDKDEQWAAENAVDVHGSGFVSQPAPGGVR